MPEHSKQALESSKRVIVVGNYGQQDEIIVLNIKNIEDQGSFYSVVKPAYFESPETNKLNNEDRQFRKFISPLDTHPKDGDGRRELSYSDQPKTLNCGDDHVKNKAAAERGLKKLEDLRKALKTVWQLDTLENRVHILEKACSDMEKTSKHESSSFSTIFRKGEVIDAIADFLFCSSQNSWEKQSLIRLEKELNQADSSRANNIKEKLILWKSNNLKESTNESTNNTYKTLEWSWKQIEEVVNGAVDQAEIFAGIVSHLDPSNSITGSQLSSSLMNARNNKKFGGLERPIPNQESRLQAEEGLSIVELIPIKMKGSQASPDVLKSVKDMVSGEDNSRIQAMLQPELKYDQDFIFQVAKKYVANIVVKLNPVIGEAISSKNKFGEKVYEEFLKPLWELDDNQRDSVKVEKFTQLLSSCKDLKAIYDILKKNQNLDDCLKRLLENIGTWIDVEKLKNRLKKNSNEDQVIFNAIAFTKMSILAKEIQPALEKIDAHTVLAQSIVLTIPEKAQIPLLTHGGIMSGRYFIFEKSCNFGDKFKEKVFMENTNSNEMEQQHIAYETSFGSLAGPAQIRSNLEKNEDQKLVGHNEQPAGASPQPYELPSNDLGKDKGEPSVDLAGPSSVNDATNEQSNSVTTAANESKALVKPAKSAFQDLRGLIACVNLGKNIVNKYAEISENGEKKDPILEAYFNVVVLCQFFLHSHVLGQEDLSAALPILLSAVGEWGSNSGPGCSKVDFFDLNKNDDNIKKWIATELNLQAWPLSSNEQQTDLSKIFDYLLKSATSRDTVDEFAEEVRQLAEFCQVVTRNGGEVVLVKNSTQPKMIDVDDPRNSLLYIHPARCVVLAPDKNLDLNSLVLAHPCNDIFIPMIVTRSSTQKSTLDSGVLPVIYSDKIGEKFQFYQGEWKNGSLYGFYLGNHCRFTDPVWLLTAALLNLPPDSCGTVNQTPASYQQDVRKSFAWNGHGKLLSGLRQYLAKEQALAIVPALALINSLRHESVRSQCTDHKIDHFQQLTSAIIQNHVKPVYEKLVSLGDNKLLPKLSHPDVTSIGLFSVGASWKNLNSWQFGTNVADYSFDKFKIELKQWGLGGRKIDDELYKIINQLVFG